MKLHITYHITVELETSSTDTQVCRVCSETTNLPSLQNMIEVTTPNRLKL